MTNRRRLIALVLMASLLAGCWSRRELTDVSFVGALGIDWVEDEYQVSLAVISPRRQPTEGGGPPGQDVWTLAERAPALDAAIAKLDQTVQRAVTLSHVRAIVFGEEMARRGIGPAVDYLLRTVDLRPTAWVAVTNGEAFDLLKAKPRQERVSIDGPLGYQDLAQKRSSIAPARRITHVSEILQEEGIDLTLPLFRRGHKESPNPERAKEEGALHEQPENANEVIYGGAGVFRTDRLVAWLTPEESRGHLWGLDKVVHGAISVECPIPKPNQRIVFRLRSGRGRTITRLENGRLHGIVHADAIVDVNEVTCTEPVLQDHDVSRFEKALAGRIREDIGKALAVSRETGADIFGFGQSLFRQAPASYISQAGTWPERLEEMEITISIETRVARLGQLDKRYEWKRYR